MQISAGFNPSATSTTQYATQQSSAGVLEAAASPPAANAASGSEASTESIAVKISADPKPVIATGTYAEIWRDGQKVAEVDLYGGVTSLNGMIASFGSSGGGPQMAARRASQIALAVGGEIRSAGQVVDRQTLLMRDRLQRAYTP